MLGCVWLCDPRLLSPWDSPGLQARILEWVTIHFSGSVFTSIPKKGNAKECSNYHTIAHISDPSEVMFKILQARLQHYMNWAFPDFQDGFRKSRGTRDQIASIHWMIENTREFQQNIYIYFIDYAKVFDCVDYKKTVENSSKDGNTRPPYLPSEKSVYTSRSNS